ncbi:uncharacterized protein TrAFT101_000354 [Trichoderma asperellum]|uniref:Luciferase domain-containing protein n=1 Tax=Trichoderma asperellum (strain ATCC 204424 / CBS 433.97 / NBRC 101777) TaxID=1042311 RepID=A0A2T3ZJ97_TRIA4|nr:hypothetical protein M441DRAFT_43019 [Trichoderma asperellum CBS 433.97]PTB44884.1 hypothetical protein M441DRAFT_43019 [Trichoderma asperellum CBS 433.97]UKZ84442.1 hypothetical protein TrAFT101_000354 [Trichoderma asperellum]
MPTWDPSRLSSLVLSYIRQHPIIFTSAVAIVPLAALAMPSYRGYIDLGPGGLPHNVFGWLLQETLRPLSLSSTTDLGVFQKTGVSAPYEPHGNTRFLQEPLAQRRGDRPVIPNYVAPQRQATEKGDAALVTRMNNHLRDLSSHHPDKLAVKASGLEAKENPALFVIINPLPKYLENGTKGEIVHVHGEASSHMVLSLTDAKEALAKGWAELHPLSGVMGRIPLPYVMIYAPRDEEEFGQWARFVDAAVAFTSAGKE